MTITNTAFNVLPKAIRDDILDILQDEVNDMPREDLITLVVNGMPDDEIASWAQAAYESLIDMAKEDDET